ncbi:hypothetical protein D0C36_03900 [Mucilaginibacter conchicola]|uniref:Uncharacterized protein n=1 Tax=Mucilaginibacter conchicola TaxID=2303333 RepID=A0A372NXD6_9SPHI|nr:hypothetical protein D0C36_03900 [Mucilaginibacter conchicola]
MGVSRSAILLTPRHFVRDPLFAARKEGEEEKTINHRVISSEQKGGMVERGDEKSCYYSMVAFLE